MLFRSRRLIEKHYPTERSGLVTAHTSAVQAFCKLAVCGSTMSQLAGTLSHQVIMGEVDLFGNAFDPVA